MNANRTSAQRLLAQAGGVSGLVYSSLPVVTFVVASSAAGLLPAIGFALSMAGLILRGGFCAGNLRGRWLPDSAG